MKNSETKEERETKNPQRGELNEKVLPEPENSENQNKTLIADGAEKTKTSEETETSEETKAAGKAEKEAAEKANKTEKKKKRTEKTRSDFSKTKIIAGTGIFAALSFVVSFLEFSLFPGTGASFLKLDFSLVFILLAGFMFGPISGFSAAAIKELLRFAAGSATGGVGEIANFIVTAAFIAVPTIVYRHKKGLPTVIITITIGSVLEMAAALFANRFINFPLFMGDKAAESFAALWYFVLLFNFIKCVAISFLTVIAYKKVSFLVKKI